MELETAMGDKKGWEKGFENTKASADSGSATAGDNGDDETKSDLDHLGLEDANTQESTKFGLGELKAAQGIVNKIFGIHEVPALFKIESGSENVNDAKNLEMMAALIFPSADQRPLGIPGLHNLGNSCFINALLQAMASCRPVVQYVHATAEVCAQAGDQSPRAAMVSRLSKVLEELLPRSCEVSPPTMNIQDLRYRLLGLSPAFRYSEQQQDADELLHLVLDAIDTARLEVKKYMRKVHAGLEVFARVGNSDPTSSRLFDSHCHSSIFESSNPLHGSIMNQMMCSSCGSISPLRASTMHVLPLPLIQPQTGAILPSLEEALRAFVTQETVEGVECFGLCNKQRRAMFRRASLGRMPPVLCLHLGRRHFSMSMGRIVKLTHHVAFPEVCDFSNFAFHKNELQRGLLANFPVLQSSRSKSELPTSPEYFSHGASSTYELCAVIVHHGSAEGGHFTAFRRLGNSTWVHVSDARVFRVSLATVLRTEAYMLFYVRRDNAIV